MFPPTEDGIKAAIDATTINDWWEEKVDWSADTPKPEAIPMDTLMPTIYLLGRLAQEQPELFSEHDHQIIKGWARTALKHLRQVKGDKDE